MKADDTNVVSSSSSGRNSVRIQSPHTYNSHVTVYVLPFKYLRDLRHVFTFSLTCQPLAYAKRMRYVARDMGGRSYSLQCGLGSPKTGRTIVAIRWRGKPPLFPRKAVLMEHRNQVDIVEGAHTSSIRRCSLIPVLAALRLK